MRLGRGADILRAQARAGVAHAQRHVAIVGQRGRDDHLSAGVIETDRGGDQVQYHLAQGAGVRGDMRQAARQRGPDDDALAIGLRLHHGDTALDEVVEVLVGESKVELTGLDP